MKGVFLSYRRDDSEGHASHLFEDLAERFGRDNVFIDVGLQSVVNFADAIQEERESAQILIAVIGRNWLRSADDNGQLRVWDPNDWVRLELECALKRNIRVIPVLVQGATMPKAEHLPTSLAPLVQRHGHEVRASRWEYDVERLADAIAAAGIKRKTQSPRKSGSDSKHRRTMLLARLAAFLVFLLGKVFAGRTPRLFEHSTQSSDEPYPPTAAGLIFISAKSEDYRYAYELFSYLSKNRPRVFFSEESLPTLGRSDYRREIDRALEEAEHMIVVTSSRENAESGWVQAEWGAFLGELRAGRKQGNIVTLAVGSIGINELPLGLRGNQVIKYDSKNFDSLLKYLS